LKYKNLLRASVFVTGDKLLRRGLIFLLDAWAAGKALVRRLTETVEALAAVTGFKAV